MRGPANSGKPESGKRIDFSFPLSAFSIGLSRKKAAVAGLGGVSQRRHREASALYFVVPVPFGRRPIGYGCGCTPSFSSSSSWMMMRGVTIIIRLWASRPMPTFLKSRLR